MSMQAKRHPKKESAKGIVRKGINRVFEVVRISVILITFFAMPIVLGYSLYYLLWEFDFYRAIAGFFAFGVMFFTNLFVERRR